jgi:hypothetical protein
MKHGGKKKGQSQPALPFFLRAKVKISRRMQVRAEWRVHAPRSSFEQQRGLLPA